MRLDRIDDRGYYHVSRNRAIAAFPTLGGGMDATDATHRLGV